jgi:hypothetical protein
VIFRRRKPDPSLRLCYTPEENRAFVQRMVIDSYPDIPYYRDTWGKDTDPDETVEWILRLEDPELFRHAIRMVIRWKDAERERLRLEQEQRDAEDRRVRILTRSIVEAMHILRAEGVLTVTVTLDGE